MNFKKFGCALTAGLLLSMGSMSPANAQAQRSYDCSKPGNANKTVCKNAVAKPAPKPRTPEPAARNYDCTKPGNANKAACKKAVAPAPQAAPATPARAPSAPTNVTGPQGATAKCRDNTYSHSKTHSGACSHHGGVATWF